MARKLKVPSELREASKVKVAKPKRKRKPMTPEQKAAAVERLAKARAAKGPVENKSIPENIRHIPDEDPLSVKNVRAYLKQNVELLKAIKSLKDSKDYKERLYYCKVSTYVDNLKRYLNSGVYTDNRWGMDGENRIKYKCFAMAYHKDGTPKRTVGVIYPDCGEWTQEMENESYQ